MRPYFSTKHVYNAGDTPTGGIIHTYSQGYTAENEEGHLSIKTMWGGESYYKLGRKKLCISDSVYAVLNYGQPYRLEVSKDVESFCLFFKKEMVETIWQTHTESLSNLLDASASIPDISFIEKPYHHDETLSPLLLQLRHKHLQPSWSEETWHEYFPKLALALLQLHQQVDSEVGRLSAARASTRKELYQRLSRAKDYLEDNPNKSLNLKTIAQIANLSPYHFQKCFKEVFHQSPAQYHNSCRMNHAKHLLQTSNDSVLEICIKTDFESLSSFSKAFKRHTGTSPSQYRNQL